MNIDGFGLAPQKPEGQTVEVEGGKEPETTCWHELISEKILQMGLDLVPMVYISLSNAEQIEPFTKGFGHPCGKPFIAWSDRHVFFSVVYDGMQSVGVVPRNPDENLKPIEFGGGSYWETDNDRTNTTT